MPKLITTAESLKKFKEFPLGAYLASAKDYWERNEVNADEALQAFE